VSRYLLDTNILSNPSKAAPSLPVAAWLGEQADDILFIASLSVAEIWLGVQEKPAGKKRAELERWFAGPNGPQAVFAGRVLPFDTRAGLIWGRLMAEETKAGHSRSAMDMIFAAVAEANDCILVMDNEKHFAGLKFFNPMRSTGASIS
jgi:predicted nucleic acid-binding protein